MALTEEERKAKKKAYAKAYYEQNKDSIRAAQKERSKIYRAKNKEKRAAYNKAYNEANKEARAAYHKSYREKNRERIREHAKEYYDNNREEMLAKGRAHYAATIEYQHARKKAYYEATKEARKEQRNTWSARYRAKYPEKVKEAMRRWRSQNHEYEREKRLAEISNLDDRYVKYLICVGTNLDRKHVPQELVEVKRIQMQITREIKNAKRNTTA